MNLKIICVPGLICLTCSHILFSFGFDFLQHQKPIDFAHTFMLIGALLLFAFNFVFPKSIINTIAIILTTLGIIAHVGMCIIDFKLWGFGDDYNARNEMISQLKNSSFIYYTFLIIGPALLYAGLATHAWKFIKSNTLFAVATLFGSGIIGYGQMSGPNSIFIISGCLIFSIGLIGLLYSSPSRMK